jgi:MFS family permease
MRKLTIYCLNFLTLLNHAVVSWIIVSMYSMQNIFPFVQHLSKSSKLLFLGVLLTTKPLAEGCIAAYFMLKQVSNIRRTLLVCLFCLIASMLTFVGAVSCQSVISLFVAMFLLGVGCSAIFVIQISLAQGSNKENRTFIFNMMEWSIGLGMSIGPLVLSTIVSRHSYSLAFVCVAFTALILLGVMYNIKQRPLPSDESSFYQSAGVRYYYLAWVFFMFGWQGYFHWFPALMQKHFHQTPSQISVFYTALGAFYVFCQCAVVNFFVRFNIHRRVIFYALIFLALSFFMLGRVHSYFSLLLFSAIYMLSISFFLPFWKAYISLKNLSSHSVLFSRMTLITVLCTVLSTLLGGVMSAKSLTLSFGFFAASILMSVICFFIGELRWFGSSSRSISSI